MMSASDCKAYFLCFVLLSLVGYCDAFPAGAGNCPGQEAAVSGSHVSPDKNLIEMVGFDVVNGVSVTVDGVDVTNQDPITLALNEDVEFVVTSIETPIRGVLMRLIRSDGVDATGAILPTDPAALQDASMVCMSPAAGVTHVDNTNKTAVSAILRFDEPVLAILDVTLVFENNNLASSYAFDSFGLNFSNDQVTPAPLTMAPVTATPKTTAPVTTTSAPTVLISETQAPSTMAPTTATPTAMAPVTTTAAPTALISETQAPLTTPISASATPVMTVLDESSDQPSDVPSQTPPDMISDAFSVVPSDRPSDTPSTGPAAVPVGISSPTAVVPVIGSPLSASPEGVAELIPSDCASLDTCFLENLKTGETTALSVGESTSYVVGDGDHYTVFCEMGREGTTNAVDFTYNDETHTEWENVWYMGGNVKDSVNNVDYLLTDCGSIKTFEVVGRVWRAECFREEFFLESVCAADGS